MTISRSRGLLRGLAGIAALWPAACAQDPAAQPPGQAEAALAARFCAAVMAGDEAAAVGLMTPGLQAQVARLRAFDRGWRERNPAEKPPLGDGLRLKAWQDAPRSCDPGPVEGMEVRLTYAPASAPADTWQDRLVLTRVGEGVAVADIRYEPGTGGSFAAWLDEALATPG
jgi:hypothetical protein